MAMAQDNASQKTDPGLVGLPDLAHRERYPDGSGPVALAQPVRLPAAESAAVLSLLSRVIERPDVPIEKMEQMFDLYMKVQREQGQKEFLRDFASLQSELPSVVKRGVADKTKYARYEDIVNTIRAPMAKHGFSLSFRLEHTATAITVTGVLGHSGGHSESTSIALPPDNGPKRNQVQAWGSAVSYGKRYVTLTLLGIATEDEDDDGKKAGVAIEPEDRAEQLEKLRKLISQTGASESWFCNEYSVDRLDDMTGDQISQSITGLNARLRAAKKGGRK